MLFDENMSENYLEISPKTIIDPSQWSLKTSSKREVNSEEGLVRGFQVCQYTPGVNFAREGGDLGGWDLLSNTPCTFQGKVGGSNCRLHVILNCIFN